MVILILFRPSFVVPPRWMVLFAYAYTAYTTGPALRSLLWKYNSTTHKNCPSDEADFNPKMLLSVTDWVFGPKLVEEDPEDGTAEEEQRLSISSNHTETGGEPRMEKEKETLLPGFHQGDQGCRRPSSPPPLRSAISSSYPGEKRMSTHSVTFACPVGPSATSLWVFITALAHITLCHMHSLCSSVATLMKTRSYSCLFLFI